MADKKLINNASATTVDNFYGNRGGADVQIPLATAASVLAEQIISHGDLNVANANDVTQSGCYSYNANSLSVENMPGSYGVLVVFNPNGYAQGGYPMCQLFITHNNMVYARVKWTGTWKDWKQISTL